jgi:hypothetical protein
MEQTTVKGQLNFFDLNNIEMIMPLTRLQKEIMTEFYSYTPQKVV